LLRLGLYRQPWETQPEQSLGSSLGFMQGEGFDPATWKPSWTNAAFLNMTPADAYWGAKILAAFTDEQLRAAVAAGGLPDPRSADTLVALLNIRRDKLIRYYFARSSTIEEPIVTGQDGSSLQLSFRDLGIHQRIWSPGETTYDWRFSDPARDLTASGSAQARSMPEQILDVSWKGSKTRDGDALVTLEITTRRPGLSPDPATVFLRWDGQGYRAVGIAHGDPRE